MTVKTLNEIVRDIVLYARANDFDEVLFVQDYLEDFKFRITRRQAKQMIDDSIGCVLADETKEKP